jgi:hypothetical protein
MIASRTFVVPMGLSPMRPGTAWGSRVFPVPPRIFFPRHLLGGGGFGFFGGGCFSGFFPGFCGTSFWWGPMWAWGPNCDPDWGCNGFGYLNYDPGYGNGVSGNYDAAANGDARSIENGPFSLRAWPADDSVGKKTEISKPTVTIYLTDGSSYGVTDYWLVGGNLHYVTTYGGENSIPFERLDLQHTVDENAARGVNFTLYNEPSRER